MRNNCTKVGRIGGGGTGSGNIEMPPAKICLFPPHGHAVVCCRSEFAACGAEIFLLSDFSPSAKEEEEEGKKFSVTIRRGNQELFGETL